jgi:hypothetical protein
MSAGFSEKIRILRELLKEKEVIEGERRAAQNICH